MVQEGEEKIKGTILGEGGMNGKGKQRGGRRNYGKDLRRRGN